VTVVLGGASGDLLPRKNLVARRSGRPRLPVPSPPVESLPNSQRQKRLVTFDDDIIGDEAFGNANHGRKALRCRATIGGQVKLLAQSRNPKIKACFWGFVLGAGNYLDLNLSAAIRTATRIRKDLIVTVFTAHWGTHSNLWISNLHPALRLLLEPKQ
jgi:hypothetical protein